MDVPQESRARAWEDICFFCTSGISKPIVLHAETDPATEALLVIKLIFQCSST